MSKKKNKKQTQTEKRAERQALYNTNPRLYDASAAVSAAGLLALVDEIETANAVFPQIFTHNLVKQVNLTLDRMYKNNTDNDLCDEHINLSKLFDQPINLIKSV